VAGAAAVAAVAIGLLHVALPGLLVSSPLGWLIVAAEGRPRLAGIMTAPNAMAMLALLPICLLAAWMLHRRALPAWLAGSAVLAVLAVGALLTFSRSAVLAVAAVAVAYAWYIRRAAAIVMLLMAVVAAVILVPLYLEQRAGTPLPGVGATLQEFFTAGDSIRASGWAAAVRMTMDSPLIGQGFRSYVVLHAEFGDVAQQAPHNEWLRLYAEQGVLVGTAGLVFLMAALTTFWRTRGVLGLGAFGVLLSYAIMASFNNPLNYAQLNIPVFAVLGTAIGMALRAGPPAGLSDPAAEGPRGSSGA
jgi:O-antigen ligase